MLPLSAVVVGDVAGLALLPQAASSALGMASAAAVLQRIAGSGLREFDHDVGGLDHGDRAHPRREPKLVGGFSRNQRNQSVRTSLQLDLRHDPVPDDAR